MEKSLSIIKIAEALCKFQGEVQKIPKTETNPFFKNKYADLSSILDVIREPLFNNGLSIVQFPKGKNELETMLMHTSGEWMSCSYEMTPTKNDPQGLGSTITYQRRYALGSVLSLNIDIDDDGNKGSGNKPGEKKEPTIETWMTEKQFKEVKTLLNSDIAEEYEKGKKNFIAFSTLPFGMKKEYKTELESLVK